MKHTIKNDSETKIILEVALDSADLNQVKLQTLKRLGRDLKVSGFRKGKAPASVVEKSIDSNILIANVAEDAVNHFMIQVMQSEKIQPLDHPKVDVKKYVPNDNLEFTATIEILPAIKLGDYKKLKVKKPLVKVEEKDIEEVIDRMQTGMAEKKATKNAAKNGDEVLIDFDGSKDGKPVAGASGKAYPLVLGSDSFIPGFEEGLVGKKSGEELDLPLTFPKDYHHKPLAGAKVNFEVKVNEVKEVVKPELDDEFAKKCGPFETVDELKEDIKREVTQQKEREAEDKLKDQLLEKIVEKSKIPLPEILVSDQMTNIERDFTQNLMYRGMDLDKYLDEQSISKEDWQEKDIRPQAVRRVQVGLVLAEIGKLEDIQVSKEELESRLQMLLQQYGNDEKIKTQLDTAETRRDISNRLVTEKTIDKILELNK